MTTYSEKLKDPRWQKKRLEILSRDSWKCLYCGDEKRPLHIHHEKYEGDPWEVKNEYLKTTCDTCHVAITLINKICNHKVDIIKIYTTGHPLEGRCVALCVISQYGYESLCVVNVRHDVKSLSDVVIFIKKETINEIKNDIENHG